MMKAQYIKMIVICATITAMFVAAITALQSPILNKQIDNEPVIALKQFYDSDGEEIVLPETVDACPNEDVTIQTILPTDIKNNDYLCIWTDHQNLNADVDGITIYRYQMNEAGFFGRLDGNFWNFIPLEPDMGGEELTLTFSSRLSVGGQMQEVNLGSKSALILRIIKIHLLSFILSAVILFLGLFIIFLCFLLRESLKHDSSLLYLGGFTAIIGLWLLCETQLPEIFLENFYFVTIVSCMCVLACFTGAKHCRDG